MSEQCCTDKELNGVCTKGKDCPICNKSDSEKKIMESKREQNVLNINAKEYIPPKKKIPEKLNLNLNAKEYVPNSKVADEGEEDEEEENQEEIDMIMKDVIEDDLMEELGNDSDDEDKWFPLYKDCECCKGFVYKCQGDTCKSLGQCYCKMKDDCDEDFHV